jgi:hypothetical protein
MALDLRKLTMLKMKLMQEKELKDVMTYFFDHFGESEEFLDVSEPTRHDLVESTLAQTVGPMVGSKGKAILVDFILLYIPQYDFYHGAFILNGRMANNDLF